MESFRCNRGTFLISGRYIMDFGFLILLSLFSALTWGLVRLCASLGEEQR